ncbi:non-ribosomal peptide synthetase, partial [Pseudoalteromonas rubra]
ISGKGPLALGDIKVEMLEDEQAAVKCDLDISAGLDEQGLHLSWLYDSALFDRAHIAKLQAHFERLLRQAVTLTPGRPDTFRLLSQAEQSALLAAGEGQQAASDVALLPTQFSAQARRHGSRIALQWQDQTLSYDALEQRANQLARLLRERGVGAEQRVGIYLPRSIDMVVAMLGVLKAGGAYVPIDPAYPQQRVAHILADTEMAQLLTHSDLAAQLTTTSVTCIALDEAKTQ